MTVLTEITKSKTQNAKCKKTTKTKKRKVEKRLSRRIQKKGCWYSLYKCKLDRHFLCCARYFNLVCKNDTATNKKAERATTPVPLPPSPSPSPVLCFVSTAQAAAAGHLASIRPRSPLWPWPIFGAGPFRILVVVIFKSKTRLHQKGLTRARRAWVWKFFSCRIFMRKCQAAREQNTHAHTHTYTQNTKKRRKKL